jgi:hypothetical protein
MLKEYNISIAYPLRVRVFETYYESLIKRRIIMNISMDDAARNGLRDMLNEKNKDAVRIVIKGFG